MCFNNSKLSKSEPCNEQKSRDARQSLSRQRKVGVKENVRMLFVNFSFFFFLVYNQYHFPQESPASTSSISGTDIDATDTEHAFNSTSLDNDLWLIILNCHQSQDPPGALINASRSNLMPILAILATCYEVLFYVDQ